ncbi:hypothetical protein AAD001_05010 [Colwelliaceae bacterium 6471]
MNKLLLTLFCLGLSSSAYAKTLDKIEIPVMDNAKIFAQFNEDFPAVVNYFVKTSEEDVISFYQNIYGEPQLQERKRGRLTLRFAKADQMIRVIISPQNNNQQVDILIEHMQE